MAWRRQSRPRSRGRAGSVASATRSTWRPPAAKASSAPRQRDDDRQHQQEPAARDRLHDRGWMGHHGSAGSLPVLGRCVSARNVAEPVAWNRRSSRRNRQRCRRKRQRPWPVMTSACGTGSPPNPAAAPLCATTPKNVNTPEPMRLKARILRSGCGFVITPIEPETHGHGCAKPEHDRRAHDQASRSGGPATSRPSVTAIVRIIANSMARISGLAYAIG